MFTWSKLPTRSRRDFRKIPKCVVLKVWRVGVGTAIPQTRREVCHRACSDDTAAARHSGLLNPRAPEIRVSLMSVKEVPSDHDFDPAYVQHWTESIMRYRPERKRIFNAFAAEAARLNKGLSVFELGCGPGFLAEALLENCDIARYTLVIFHRRCSISAANGWRSSKTKPFSFNGISKRPTGATVLPPVSPWWSRSRPSTSYATPAASKYAQLHGLLAPCGMILICDHVKPLRPSRGSFQDGQRTPGDFQESGIYRAERNLPCRGFVSDGGGEALRAIALFHRSAEHHAAPYRMGCIWI